MWRKPTRLAGVVFAGMMCVSAIAQPGNDRCNDAVGIGLGAVNGTTVGAAADGGAACGDSDGAPDVYYRFTAPATCTFEVLTCDGNTGYDTVVSVHTDCPATPGNTIACNDDGAAHCGPHGSYVTFDGVRNATYVIRVAGAGTDSGSHTLVVRQLGRPQNDTCAGAIPIGGTSAFFNADTTCAMSEGILNCGPSTTGSPNHFFRYTSPDDGVVTFETCDETTTFDTYLSASTDCPHTELNLVACNDDTCGLASRISFNVVRGASYIIRVAGFNGARGGYRLRWRQVPGELPNDSCFGAQPISLGTVNGSTVRATNDAQVSCFGAGTPDVYYVFRSPVEAFVRMDTCGPGTSFDTVLSVHSGCPTTDQNLIACNDNGCDVGSSVTFLATPGAHYFIRVAGAGTGAFQLRCTAEVDAVIFDPSTLGEYYLIGDNRTMASFRDRAFSLGGHMAVINSFSEAQFVSQAVMQHRSIARSVAIGLSDEVTEGVLRWDTGFPVEYTFFLNGQPDNFNGAEDYVHILDPVTGLWNDYPDGAYPGLFGAAESDRSVLTYGISPENGHLYLLYRASSWEGAQARARAMGGNLVSIEGPAENEFVRSRFGGAVQGNLWIGLSDRESEGAFAWSDGSTSTFRAFAAGEPNNAGGSEDFVEMNGTTGHWNDVPNIQAHAPKHGVAELVLPTVIGEPVNGPGGCGRYVLLSPSGFYPAHFMAQFLGGRLVSISSAEENEFIRATFADAGGGRRLWLGATDRDDDGNFIWLSGDPFDYTNFLAGEPNNWGGNEDYLEMFDPATGVWNDISTLDPSAPLHFAVVELICRCDWNGSGAANSQDFFDFLSDFFVDEGDFNCDRATNSQDFFDFLACFFGGCD